LYGANNKRRDGIFELFLSPETNLKDVLKTTGEEEIHELLRGASNVFATLKPI
jgi:hypothetical protein